MKLFMRSLAVASIVVCSAGTAAFADLGYGTPPPPYNRLNLTPVQAARIENLDSDWQSKYRELHPRLMDQQQHLSSLLAAPKADPIEISTTQQQINQIKEQLSGFATANYLEKRRVLDQNQQQQLNGWMRNMFDERYGHMHNAGFESHGGGFGGPGGGHFGGRGRR